ncbi:MAG TPA: ABC transporter permease [Vicinamibacterales bacterium]|nr:ABC transporter permease [Vicinamibacterales bacterium]
MRWARRLIVRLRSVFRRDRAERELDAELKFHFDQQVAENVAAGMRVADARAAARRVIGSVAYLKDECRNSLGLTIIDNVNQDVRYAIRALRKSPAFAATAILTLALGVGANAAVFSVVNAVLLRPLPYHDPDQIVAIGSSFTNRPLSHLFRQISLPDFQDWQAQSAAFQALAFYGGRQTAVTIGATADYALVTRVSPEFFRVFDAQPVLGRLFSIDESKSGSTGAAVVSDAFRQRYFGNGEHALGQTIRVFDRAVSIVGVLPGSFDFPAGTDIWFPDDATENSTRTVRAALNRLAVGRLKDDTTLERAQAELTAIATRLQQMYPASNKGRGVSVIRLRDDLVGNVGLTLYLLLAAVALVLLIACTNLATLLLARATARSQEIAVRAALGASYGRLVRQMLAEGVVLALISGGAGVLLAVWGTKALVALAPADVPRIAEAAVDARVLVFALAVSAIASLLMALVPAWQASRVDVEHALRLGGRRGGLGGRSGLAREALVTAELALSVVLLASGGLLIQSLVALQRVALGFRPEHVLVVGATIRTTSDPQKGSTLFFRDLLRQVSTIPGVTAAGATMAPPGHIDSSSSYWIDHLPKELNTNAPQAVMSIVAPGTFAALGIPFTRGRDFHDGDTPAAPATAIINDALARQAFPGQDAIGHTIFCGFDSLNPMVIVGVVGDVRQAGPEREPSPECYMPYLQHFYNGNTLSLVVRSTVNPTALIDTVRRKAYDLSPEVPVRFTTLEALIAEHVAAPRFRALLVGLFAAVALGLAIVGIFGVMVYVVTQRTTEIGLRMALGATPRDVRWLLLKRGLVITGIGLAVGLVTSLGLTTPFLGSLLFGVKPTDPTTYAVVAGILGITSLMATYIPSRRSARIEPLVALRHE